MVTFTSDARGDRDMAAPAAAYLRTMMTGLRESQGWSDTRIGSYLAGIPRAAGAWSADEIEALAA